MRECQLCGTRSWGPLQIQGRTLLLNAIRPEDTEVDFTAFRQCDNCGMPARDDIIERPAPDAEFPDISLRSVPHIADAIFGPLGGSRPPDPMTVATKAIEAMMEKMPAPATRLERLVCALLRTERWNNSSLGVLVLNAHYLASEMDKVSKDDESIYKCPKCHRPGLPSAKGENECTACANARSHERS